MEIYIYLNTSWRQRIYGRIHYNLFRYETLPVYGTPGRIHLLWFGPVSFMLKIGA